MTWGEPGAAGSAPKAPCSAGKPSVFPWGMFRREGRKGGGGGRVGLLGQTPPQPQFPPEFPALGFGPGLEMPLPGTGTKGGCIPNSPSYPSGQPQSHPSGSPWSSLFQLRLSRPLQPHPKLFLIPLDHRDPIPQDFPGPASSNSAFPVLSSPIPWTKQDCRLPLPLLRIHTP